MLYRGFMEKYCFVSIFKCGYLFGVTSMGLCVSEDFQLYTI